MTIEAIQTTLCPRCQAPCVPAVTESGEAVLLDPAARVFRFGGQKSNGAALAFTTQSWVEHCCPVSA